MFYISVSVHELWELSRCSYSPKMRPTVDQVKDLSRVQELLEASKEFNSLVVTTFGVDKDQQWTGT